MELGRPGPVADEMVDLSGNSYGEIAGFVVVAGVGASDYVSQRIFANANAAERLAETLRLKYPSVTVMRLALNVEIGKRGQPVVYSPTIRKAK